MQTVKIFSPSGKDLVVATIHHNHRPALDLCFCCLQRGLRLAEKSAARGRKSSRKFTIGL